MTAHPIASVYRPTPHNLARLARALRSGELVAAPTETVYGLAANALDTRACRRIFRAKGRPASDPLIVHIHTRTQLTELAVPNEAAEKLARAFWPGPLTLVLPKRPLVPAIVSAGLPSVAIRMPAHRLFRRLLALSGVPLAAPSANPFGYVSPTTAEHVATGLGRKIAYILDGGPCRIGLESTIVDLRDPRMPRLLRPGAIARADLENVLGHRIRAPSRSSPQPDRTSVAQAAPGMLTRHYSPRTPAVLRTKLSRVAAARSPSDEAWVFVARPEGLTGRNIFWLDERGDLSRAARRLFATLRLVDAGGFSLIHLERARGAGLAAAINDRLARAAARS